MRVLVVSVVHDPQDARIRHRQVQALTAAGHQVTQVAPFTAYGRSVGDDVTGVDVPRAHGRRRLSALAGAVRVLVRQGPAHDVVLLHDPELLVAAALAAPRLRRSVVVWDVHEDTAAALPMKPWLPGPARRALPRLVAAVERLAERRVRLLLAEESYRDRFRCEHPVVPNTTLVPDGEPAPSGRGRAVYLGRLTRPRGALDLVELGRRLRGEVVVELIGDATADVEAAVRAAADAGHVRWHGFVPNDEALRLLAGATVGLSLLHDQPNYAHSRPTKVIEYMAHGVPVVTTPNAASVELVERYGSGLVVGFDDPDALEGAVRTLDADDDLRRRLATAGSRAARGSLTWASDGPAFVAVLEGWAAARPR